MACCDAIMWSWKSWWFVLKIWTATSCMLSCCCCTWLQQTFFLLSVPSGLRLHFHSLVKGLTAMAASKAQLGLGHSYSRAKVKFNVNRVDNMIIQSIALLDQLDKDINTFSMRVRYGSLQQHHWNENVLLKRMKRWMLSAVTACVVWQCCPNYCGNTVTWSCCVSSWQVSVGMTSFGTVDLKMLRHLFLALALLFAWYFINSSVILLMLTTDSTP